MKRRKVCAQYTQYKIERNHIFHATECGLALHDPNLEGKQRDTGLNADLEI